MEEHPISNRHPLFWYAPCAVSGCVEVVTMDFVLPAEEVRAAVAECLHTAVGTILTPSIAQIGPINTIACFLLKHITRVNHLPVAGSI